jgi:transposase
MSHLSVNSWLSRYKPDGLSGLYTRPGRSRKSILNREEAKNSIPEAIKASRQRMRTAKAEWKVTGGKTVSDSTFKAFFKAWRTV